MTASLVIFGILGLASTAVAFVVNRHLFAGGRAGSVSPLEAVYYVVGVRSGLGWGLQRPLHPPVRPPGQLLELHQAAVHQLGGPHPAAQDYIIVNVVLLPLWTIVEGGRRGFSRAWIFFVISLFTSLAFSIALFLAFMERQLRYNRRARRSHSCSPG